MVMYILKTKGHRARFIKLLKFKKEIIQRRAFCVDFVSSLVCVYQTNLKGCRVMFHADGRHCVSPDKTDIPSTCRRVPTGMPEYTSMPAMHSKQSKALTKPQYCCSALKGDFPGNSSNL
jgi:hypothetical protein